MIQNRKDQILSALEEFYISPLTEMSMEVEALKRIVAKRPFRAQISMPKSWRVERYLSLLIDLTFDEAIVRLQYIVNYLAGGNGSVFDHQYSLIIGNSLPYFEWNEQNRLRGINSLLGELRIFYLYRGNEEAALDFFTFLQEIDLFSQIVIVGDLIPESITSQLQEKGMPVIESIDQSFWDTLIKNRSLPQLSLTTFFHPTTDILLMSAEGKYLKNYSRSEFTKQHEQIKREYFIAHPSS